MPPYFYQPGWREIRLDINPDNEPDIVGSMTDMAAVADGSVDAIYSSHNVEHVFPHEVPIVLREFRRVLADDGFAVITCPDLKSISALVAEDKLTDPAYVAPAGPITPLDMLYGHIASLKAGNHYMAHKCGFTEKTLTAALREAGFGMIAGLAVPQAFALWMVASKSKRDEADLRALVMKVLAGAAFAAPE
jgi:SAM-dependent methyltransferase